MSLQEVQTDSWGGGGGGWMRTPNNIWACTHFWSPLTLVGLALSSLPLSSCFDISSCSTLETREEMLQRIRLSVHADRRESRRAQRDVPTQTNKSAVYFWTTLQPVWERMNDLWFKVAPVGELERRRLDYFISSTVLLLYELLSVLTFMTRCHVDGKMRHVSGSCRLRRDSDNK